MSQLNIKGLIDNIKERTNVYTPIVDAIVNSIEAIAEAKRTKGEIKIILKRESSPDITQTDNTLIDISSIEVRDNGIGFNKKNRDSFDTLFSDLKFGQGGKGYGRFTFIKYFESVRIMSVYSNNNKYFRRDFDFGHDKQIIENEKHLETDDVSETGTVLFLERLKDKKLEKKAETVARKLMEKILIYFIDDTFNCPRIVLVDDCDKKEIVLNDYIKAEKGEIKEIASKNFTLQNASNSASFKLKVFKVFGPENQKSKISLVAYKREVTETPIQDYIPEFVENFIDQHHDGVTKEFMIKTYVMGDYLNRNVSLERVTFNFHKKGQDIAYPFSQENIEREAANHTKDVFPADIISRQTKKKQKIDDYVRTSAPWHKSYVSELDLTSVSYNINEEGMEIELQKAKYHKEQIAKSNIKRISEDGAGNLEGKIDEIIKEITEIGKSDLAHYVCNRKVVLDFLKKLLERNDDGSAKYEKDIHNVIFPMGKDSTETDYEDHNLWILDERLVFSQFIASDKKIDKKTSPTEPDLVVFNQKKSFRNGDNEFSNPLTIFEFKRPKREKYEQDDDPVLQIGGYLEEIRNGKYETPKGIEKLKVNDNTPVYGYIVCDIVEKIKSFARNHQLTVSADEEGYFGYHNGYKMYIEIMSYKKLLKNAAMRNEIFFQKLGLK